MKLRMKSNAPTRKVGSSTLAGALSIVMVWLLSEIVFPAMRVHFGFPAAGVPSEVASALTTLIMFVTAYLVPPGPRDEPIPIR